MSQYNKDTSKSEPKLHKRLLTTKPFCDCRRCTCQNCPDILNMLSITVTDTTCRFGSKVTYNDVDSPDPGESSESPNLLDVLNKERDCNCKVVARGIRDHVHMNLGMTERRDQIRQFPDACDTRCKAIVSETSSTAEKDKAVPDKDIKPIKDVKIACEKNTKPAEGNANTKPVNDKDAKVCKTTKAVVDKDKMASDACCNNADCIITNKKGSQCKLCKNTHEGTSDNKTEARKDYTTCCDNVNCIVNDKKGSKCKICENREK